MKGIIVRNSWIMKLVKNFKIMTIMWFICLHGEIITAKDEYHENIHVKQFNDCFGLGIALGVIIMFVLFALDIKSLWMLLLILVPFTLYYIWYALEFLVRLIITFDADKAYKGIVFEQQAYELDDEYWYPCEYKTGYVSFSFIKYYTK